jgi:hypothetical protein
MTFAKACRRLPIEKRRRLVQLQMSPHTGSSYGGSGGYLPDDCSECGACGEPMLGSGWCSSCYREFNALLKEASDSLANPGQTHFVKDDCEGGHRG